MAEAAVLDGSERQESSKFFCHQCSIEIRPKLPDYTCPECDTGFIEEISEPQESPPQPQAPVRDPAAEFAEIWGRAFLESFGDHTAERDEGMAWARDRDTDDEDEGSTRRQHRAFQPARVAFRRTRPIRNQYLQGLFQYFSDRIDSEVRDGGGGGPPGLRMGGIPINIVPLHGNPEDYAWGAGGLDSIITQLLNQLEGSGAPPAQQDKIDSLPVVTISQKQIDNVLQCSVCMEDFKLDEEVNKLPCDHHYHKDCIVPWLKLVSDIGPSWSSCLRKLQHGTCPVCRKDLNGEDTSLKDGITPVYDPNSSNHSDSSSDMT